jgi:hypothetical protein
MCIAIILAVELRSPKGPNKECNRMICLPINNGLEVEWKENKYYLTSMIAIRNGSNNPYSDYKINNLFLLFKFYR